jgi:hypothetical protein
MSKGDFIMDLSGNITRNTNNSYYSNLEAQDISGFLSNFDNNFENFNALQLFETNFYSNLQYFIKVEAFWRNPVTYINNFISDLGLNTTEKILFILTKPNKEFWLASRNLKNVEVTTANCLNIEQLLKTTHIILSNASLDSINSIYGKQYA